MSEVPEWLVVALAWILLLAPLLPLAVAVIFAPDLRSHNIPLRERAGLAVRDALLSGAVALVAGAYLFGWEIEPRLSFALIALAYLSISAPSAVWLWLFVRGRYR